MVHDVAGWLESGGAKRTTGSNGRYGGSPVTDNVLLPPGRVLQQRTAKLLSP